MTTYIDAYLEAAVKLVADRSSLAGVASFGNLLLPKESAEVKRCSEIQEIFEDYATRKDVSSPLSIAVFGPPGSGKSFLVNELINSLPGKNRFGQLKTINLSQITDSQNLAKRMKDTLGGATSDVTNVLFLDEFDTPLNGETLGWLKWFLAPMQDGEFLADGQVIKLRRTILAFAGGTASTLSDFERRAAIDPRDFRAKKVPDFISRLHAFIDIQGINTLGNDRLIRRAIVLRHLLAKRWPDRWNDGSFSIDQDLTKKLLSTAHFIHGVRSIGALLSTSRVSPDNTLREGNLPDRELRRLHISRGPLDGRIIGVSAGLQDPYTQPMLSELTRVLLRSGATLAYGGDFIPEGTLQDLVEAAKLVPDDLVDRADRRIRNYVGFPSFLSTTVLREHEKAKGRVDFLHLETLSELEKTRLGVPRGQWFPALPDKQGVYQPHHHLAWAISLFRMRVRLCHDVDALIVIGGKDSDSWGRFPGVAEEVLLALMFGKPIYVMGGRGGAAASVGRLIGLGEAIVDSQIFSANSLPIWPELFQLSSCFNVPGFPRLPQTLGELRSWLQERSIWTIEWPWNGLNVDENRLLFRTPIPGPESNKCVSLVTEGLLRLDWRPPRPALPASVREEIGKT